MRNKPLFSYLSLDLRFLESSHQLKPFSLVVSTSKKEKPCCPSSVTGKIKIAVACERFLK